MPFSCAESEGHNANFIQTISQRFFSLEFYKCDISYLRSLRPVVVEPFEQQDDVDGYPDKNLPRKNAEFYKAREVGPRFAQIGSFEHEYGTRWKQLHELYKQKEEALKREMAMEEEKLEAQMEFARYEHETEMLRERKCYYKNHFLIINFFILFLIELF